MAYQDLKPSFARHETFGLRYSWLPKGFRAFRDENGATAFTDDNATVRLGVGKNMVNSIFYWLQAADVIEKKANSYFRTTFGDVILGEMDPYLEDDGSLQLIHWRLCCNPELALAFYWFFGRFHALSFSYDEAVTAFKDFCRGRLGVKVSDSSLEKDINIVLRMYAPLRKKKDSVEDSFDNPMAQLGFAYFNELDHRYMKPITEQPELDTHIFSFVVSDFAAKKGTTVSVSLTDLMKGQECLPGPASCFCLSQSGTITMLERMQREYPEQLELKEQAGNWILYFREGAISVSELNELSLKKYYQG
ncbi:DUF4007 family protein [Arsukibacterium ikkense]|uniref:DUF4007 family protein n=1 Tax=Arsukibacterium ikkense TaxID=336831 RepID=UPI0006993087|nr:DUF4007 family protein [Arsukibacterium ikkense]